MADYFQSIKNRRTEERIKRLEQEERDRIKFVKDMNEKNLLERAKVVHEAKQLLLHRKPAFRLINRALLWSEVFFIFAILCFLKH